MGDLPNVCVTASRDSLYDHYELYAVRTHTLHRSDNVLKNHVYHIAKTTGAAHLMLYRKIKLYKRESDKIKVTEELTQR